MPTNLNPRVPEKKEYELLPVDTYNAIIEKIEDDERTKYMSQEKEMYIKFTFQLTDRGYEGRKLWANATPSLFAGSTGLSASTLYSILAAVNNRNYTEEESQKITAQDVNDVEGRGLRLIVQQVLSQKGEMKNKISNYLPLKGDMTKEEVANEEMSDIPAVESEDPTIPF